MPKITYDDLDADAKSDYDDYMDVFSFEKYCGACIFFDTDECPYNGEVFQLTQWNDINCKKFFD